jgi:thiol-disulfide isomerase/thioredoxin
MVYLEINRKNYNNGSPSLIDKLNNKLNNKSSKIFILFYMEGCGPCNATRPEWSKLKNVLSNDILNDDEIVIVSIDQELTNKLKNIKSEPSSFPTMRFMTNAGENVENYEDSNISKKDRTIDSFVEWIQNKTDKHVKTKKLKNMRGGKKTKKKYGGKWSLKYKRSINCKRPKGFSQKQYCKYSRKNK